MYLCTHWLIIVCALTGDQTFKVRMSGQCSNQLCYPGRDFLLIFNIQSLFTFRPLYLGPILNWNNRGCFQALPQFCSSFCSWILKCMKITKAFVFLILIFKFLLVCFLKQSLNSSCAT